MPFKPIGGFPPIVRKVDMGEKKNTDVRAFSTKIVNIKDIMQKKRRQENLKSVFGPNEAETEAGMEVMVEQTPHEYDTIENM